MKKWKKTALTLGVAATLMVPGYAGASGYTAVYNTSEKPGMDLSQFKSQKEHFSKDTLIIKYSHKISASEHKQAGAEVIKSYPSLGYDVVKINQGQKRTKVLQKYASLSKVTHVSPSAIASLAAAPKQDPKAKDMYHLEQLNVEKAQKMAGTHEVTVAVVDTWTNTSHPELKNRVLPAYNVANPASSGIKDAHGTHVSGIIGAEKGNGIGGYGINPHAKILPINVLDGLNASDYTIAEGILYAVEQKADVINMSLRTYSDTPILRDAVKKAVDAGVVVVVAAGNETTDDYTYPGSYDGVITVGATNDEKTLTSFSNFGPYVDVVAPGEDIYSTVHYLQKNKASFVEMSGTSMSSPIVAGVASLVKSKYPDLDSYQMEALLRQTASDLGGVGYDLTYGSGLVNPVAALSYDISKLQDVKPAADKNLAANAKEVGLEDGEISQSGKITKPYESHAYKVQATAGKPIQLVLKGTDLYDYAAKLHFYPEGSEKAADPITVNKAKAGQTEGYVYIPEANGTFVVEVKDQNGSYSASGNSAYTLKLLTADLPEDESSLDMPIELQSLTGSHPGYLSSREEADQDYYSFTVEEPTKVQMNVNGLPGVDLSLGVYFKEDFMIEFPPEMPEWEKAMYEPWPFEAANRHGVSEGETMEFEALPGMEYVLEVSSSGQDFYFDPFYLFMMGGVDFTNQNTNSLYPYTMELNTATLPEDEDQFPQIPSMEEMFMEEEMTTEEYVEAKQEAAEIIFIEEMFRMFDQAQVEEIKASAREMEAGAPAEGYIQMAEDQDWFSFTADSHAVYSFDINQAETLRPAIELFEYDERMNDLIPIGGTYYYGEFGEMAEPSLKAALKADKKYYAMVTNNGRLSLDPYKFSIKKVADAPIDQNESNDSYLNATVLKEGMKKTGHLTGNDADYFYYKNRSEDQFMNASITPKPMSLNDQIRLPKELSQQLVLLAEVFEDTNGNMEIDGSEMNKVIAYLRLDELMEGVWVGDKPLNATFKAKKDKGYFINIADLNGMGLSFTQYEIQLNEAGNRKDEDAASKASSNIPSKPLSFKKDGAAWSASAYLNIGVPFGDSDFYAFNAPKKGSYQIKMDVPAGIDGKVSVYTSKGALVKEFDYYGFSEAEQGYADLDKGKYFIKAEDANQNSSDDPYTLTITAK
ncbi:S8 family peptidase [Cytobacillus sp. NCCP-133]|uniref:S8 family peptidase n=1 Tax=Cytobacillus sp. NCCP-133 TaxID=766848 RepID=UPI0022302CC5|nr:S8 family serine peptidase [Cytobacillus sp. NCCP-133]GLB58999.1 hypothetical protein NCCP133_11320 [Cytobacillus sp. NCCP-133]